MKISKKSNAKEILENYNQDYSYNGLSLNKAKLNDSELNELAEELGLNSDDIFGTSYSNSVEEIEDINLIMGGNY